MNPALNTHNTQPIVAYGGSFDPLHEGHLHAAETALRQLNAEKVLLIPCKVPVHRAPLAHSLEQRLALINSACEKNPKFNVDTREIDRESASYAIDTLISLRNDFPTQPIVWLLGDDALQHLMSWERWQSLLDYGHLMVVSRANHLTIEFSDTLNQYISQYQTTDIRLLTNYLHGFIYFESSPMLPISATMLRESEQTKS